MSVRQDEAAHKGRLHHHSNSISRRVRPASGNISKYTHRTGKSIQTGLFGFSLSVHSLQTELNLRIVLVSLGKMSGLYYLFQESVSQSCLGFNLSHQVEEIETLDTHLSTRDTSVIFAKDEMANLLGIFTCSDFPRVEASPRSFTSRITTSCISENSAVLLSRRTDYYNINP